MTPEQKALIDAQREAYVEGALSRNTFSDPSAKQMERNAAMYKAEKLYPYSTRRILGHNNQMFKVSPEGDQILWFASADTGWIDYIGTNEVRLFYDLIQDPDLSYEPEPTIVHREVYPSSTQPDKFYATYLFSDGSVRCSCEGFKYRAHCRHTEQIVNDSKLVRRNYGTR